jgi:hypothetical protein
MSPTIRTVADLAAVYNGGVIYTDRGNGSGGPSYIPEDELDRHADPLTQVAEQDDPEAWDLARDAARLQSQPAPTIVCVGPRASGDNGHQAIYAV